MGQDEIVYPNASTIAGGSAGGVGAVGVPRITQSTDRTFGGGFFITISAPHTDSKSLVDFQDLNGDRYPDIVSSNGVVQFTTPTGVLEHSARSVAGVQPSHSVGSGTTINSGGILGLVSAVGSAGSGGGGAQTKSPNGGKFGVSISAPSQSPDFSFSGGHTSSEAMDVLMDMNGDGLPDQVNQSGGAISVRLNLGYGFSGAIPWGGGQINTSRSTNSSGGLGFSDGVRGFSGGASVSQGTSITGDMLLDLNGDGLPDRVHRDNSGIFVGFNTGEGFSSENFNWSPRNQLGTTRTLSETVSGGFSFQIVIGPLLPCPVCFIIINPSINAGLGNTGSRPELAIRDVDGDGYPDLVQSSSDNQLSVVLNATGRTNMLKHVSRPMGGTIDLEYERTGNTFVIPQSHWALNRVTVFDGVAGDTPSSAINEGADYQVTKIAYDGGRYDRDERTFLGFAKVTETRLDTRGKVHLTEARDAPAYTRRTRLFRNGSVYTKGLLVAECFEDVQGGASAGAVGCSVDGAWPAGGRPFTKTVNTYSLVDAFTGETAAEGPFNRTETIFPQLTHTERFFFEGNSGTIKSTATTFTYDALGNVATLLDEGEPNKPGEPNDDVFATFTYTSADSACNTTYIVGKPTSMVVKNGPNGALIRKREGDYSCTTGNLSQLRQYFAPTKPAQTDFVYDAFGNIQTVTGPENLNKQRFALTFAYDTDTHSHVTDIKDSFGYDSTAEYDLRFGKPSLQTDVNGNRMSNVYDAFGRLSSVRGPYEQDTPRPTLAFTYNPDAPVPWALTQHLERDADFNVKADTIDTILFTDGLKRVLETKKDAHVVDPRQGPTSSGTDVMIVSGRVALDHMGRTVRQFYPTTEEKAQNTAFNDQVDSEAPPTITDFDVLDREVRITIPDDSTTTMAYSIAGERFLTVTTDANGKVRRTFRDVRELIRRVEEE
ncbi:MAG TPA: toxin TcdB middle/N-terminal domain-containing protein, partial [Candidatus Krumholzibacteria bacterium]|nr:toxin TcdB middle/N-terminal domain-containing protein [Candidatus Krumholzibacteria bacterium]